MRSIRWRCEQNWKVQDCCNQEPLKPRFVRWGKGLAAGQWPPPSAKGCRKRDCVPFVQLFMIVLVLIILMARTPMKKKKKRFVTASVTSFGPMLDWLAQQEGDQVLCAQEHHVDVLKLGEYQGRWRTWVGRACGRQPSGQGMEGAPLVGLLFSSPPTALSLLPLDLPIMCYAMGEFQLPMSTGASREASCSPALTSIATWG